jgi:hypothetical protein
VGGGLEGDFSFLLWSKTKRAGCKHTWNEWRFMKSHIIHSVELHFYLNCDDWIKQKEKVLDQGWSLFEHDGNLNHLVQIAGNIKTGGGQLNTGSN